MSLTGNVIDIQNIQLTDTFQTWFTKTNEIVDALNPVNLYDIDDGYGTTIAYGTSGTDYNGVKYINVNAGHGLYVDTNLSAYPWSNTVTLNYASISGNAYTLTGNQAYTITGPGNVRASEVNAYDLFVVQDISDTSQGPSGTMKRVQARNMLPREIYMPTLDFWGDLNVRGALTVVAAAASTSVGNLNVGSQYIYLATTGGTTAGAYTNETNLNEGGVVLTITGGFPNKNFLWKNNGGNSYWTFNTPVGVVEPNLPVVASKFISRNFISGSTANTFIFEADTATSTRLWLTEKASAPYFGFVKDTGSSNVNLNVYNGAGTTSIAYIRAGATSQYSGVTANAFIQYANVDMVDGANATTGASAWTIPVSDQLGQLYADRHNAGQIKRRFVQASHGLTTGQAVAIVITGAAIGIPGNLIAAQANSPSTEAFGIVDRVISANEVSVTMKGYMELSSNGLRGIAKAITGQEYYLDWEVAGGLTTSTNVPQGFLYQPMFMALGGSAGILYGSPGDVIFPFANDEVYMRGLVPLGVIHPYAGTLSGLTLGLSGNTIPVNDIQYNGNWLPCDGRAVPATGTDAFVDLFNLVQYTYPMRGVVTSSNNDKFIRIRPDRGTVNLGSLGLASLTGTIKVIKRKGSDSVNLVRDFIYTSLTADSSTITLNGLTTQSSIMGKDDLLDILSISDDKFFFVPDLRGKAPFGQGSQYGALGERFNGTGRGVTGGTASEEGGLFTNYLIRAKMDSDAMILTGHNHDQRYMRRDADETVAAGKTLTLQNAEILGVLGSNDNIGIGMQPLSKASGFTGFAVSFRRDGNYSTWMSGYNTVDDANSSVGYRMNNSVANASLYLNRATSSTLNLETDSSCSGGILISAGGPTGAIRFLTNSGLERVRIDPQGTVKFREGLAYGSLIGSTPAKPTEITGLLNYDRISGAMTLGSWSSNADAFITFITTKGGTAAERMRINQDGNVGIGIDIPTLNTNGKFVHIHSGTGAAASHYTNADTGSQATEGLMVGYWNDNSAYMWNYESTPLRFGTNGTERLRIDAAGNVCIGTVSPTTKLDVNGGIKATSLTIGSATMATPNGSYPLFAVRAWGVATGGQAQGGVDGNDYFLAFVGGNLKYGKDIVNNVYWHVFTFDTPMPDTNYSVVVTCQRQDTTGFGSGTADRRNNTMSWAVKVKETTKFAVVTRVDDSTDFKYMQSINVMVIR